MNLTKEDLKSANEVETLTLTRNVRVFEVGAKKAVGKPAGSQVKVNGQAKLNLLQSGAGVRAAGKEDKKSK